MWDESGRRDAAVGYGTAGLGISGPAFSLLRDLIVRRTGVFFGDEKRDLLADKLSELVVQHGMTSFLDYYYLLSYDAAAEAHWSELMDRLAVPETYFWRQPDQLDALVHLLARWRFADHGGRSFRIWSAACCTGEEPLSIAIALAEAGWLEKARIDIVASDGSPAMLERARRGIYGERSFRNIPPLLREKYFRRESDGWHVDESLHRHVRWCAANLVNPAEAGPLAASEVIFCRNVFIYFSDEAIRGVVRTFAEHMPTPGYLFLGAAESLTRISSDFTLAEIGRAFVYTRGVDDTLADRTEQRRPGAPPALQPTGS